VLRSFIWHARDCAATVGGR